MDPNINNDEHNMNVLNSNNENKNEIKFEEYYENIGPEEDQMFSEGKHFQDLKDNNDNNNIEYEPNEEDINNNINEGELNNYKDNENDNNNENDSLEREEMENEYELVKTLNDLKEKNKKLKAMNNYQKIKIESLENELEKLNNKYKLNELELNDMKSKTGNKNNSNNKDNNSNTAFVNQIYNLNSQLEKYKNLLNEKKSEYKLLLDKYNDIQKKYNQLFVNDKKRNQELINKDKQILKLLDDLDKKNVSIVSNTAQQIKDKENEKLIQENKKLEKQKNDLYAAFKKSLKLCSILKKQKVHLENARLLAFTEEEFKNLMEENKI